MNISSDYQTSINDRTREETTLDVFRGLGYRASVYDLQALPASSCPWHWHNEVELFYMQAGSLSYRTPDTVCRFDAGDVGFVNADILHMTEAEGTAPAVQQYHIFLPGILASPMNNTVETRYLDPLAGNDAVELIRIPAGTQQAGFMREQMDLAYRIYSERAFGYELRLRNALSELWLMLLENMPRIPKKPAGQDLERVRAMVRYIEANYAEHVTLEDITQAAHIGKGEGARCFKRMLNMSPFTFLIGYRIDRAKEMLSTSAESVTDISLSCGFPSLNYFGKVFREKTGMTPLEYRAAYSRSS